MDKEDTAAMSVVFLVALGLYWGLPKETIYNMLVAIVVALFAGGWFANKKRRRG
jgi:MFS superfamily sulfate permease-like transporter